MTFGKLFSRMANILYHPSYHLLAPWKYSCNVCQRRAAFVCDMPQEQYIRKCVFCRSTPKYRAIVKALEVQTGKSLDQHLRDSAQVYEFTTTSPICRRYLGHPNYTCGAYFSNQPFGVQLRPKVWNQDCQHLSFPNASFDFVISSETMEHVRKPWDGFREIRRVLRHGGFHVFTIPYRDDRLTTARIDTSGTTDVDLLPKVYHLDPYRAEDSLVYTDFGKDITKLLCPLGFETQLLRVFDPSHDIHDDLRPMVVFLARAVTLS